jgi:energy-coupling factor transporter transmembrane protein EcfT
MIGYLPGRSPLHRAHPYTPLAVAAGLLLLAFAFQSPAAVWAVVVAAAAFAAAGGVLGAVARPAVVLALPTWILLTVLHGLLGGPPHVALGPLALSAPGVERALVFGGRITAILFAFLAALATVAPPRLVEAMTARGVPFGRIYLLVSTLTVVPRMRARVRQIIDAQQCRGLRIGGSPLARVRALGPLVVPLVLSALAEVDEQALALDVRGGTAAGRRTALAPPADRAADRLVRWTVLVGVVAAYAWKFAGAGR